MNEESCRYNRVMEWMNESGHIHGVMKLGYKWVLRGWGEGGMCRKMGAKSECLNHRNPLLPKHSWSEGRKQIKNLWGLGWHSLLSELLLPASRTQEANSSQGKGCPSHPNPEMEQIPSSTRVHAAVSGHWLWALVSIDTLLFFPKLHLTPNYILLA